MDSGWMWFLFAIGCWVGDLLQWQSASVDTQAPGSDTSAGWTGDTQAPGSDTGPGDRSYDGVMILIPAQTFGMGCTEGQSGCDSDEEPAHTVTLTRDFYIGETEVTQGQYEAVMGENPSSYPECGWDCPVDQVNWHEAALFANAVSDLEGLTACYTCSGGECEPVADIYGCEGYRLPTEAEWEAAARCGEDLLYSGSDDIESVAWYVDNSDSTPHPVAQKAANACGLYDMSGNVWEWVNDWADSDYYQSSVSTDPAGPNTGSRRVGRGGGWFSNASGARVSKRYSGDPSSRVNYGLGFRLSRSSP